MKRIFIALTIAASVFTTSAFANDGIISRAVTNNFQEMFSTAKDVSWSVTDNFYKAEFSINGQYATAFYNADGKMVALTRNITSLQLPITLQAEIKKNYDSFWISDLFEVASDAGVTYYVTLESADSKVIMKSNSSNSWSNYQKIKKA